MKSIVLQLIVGEVFRESGNHPAATRELAKRASQGRNVHLSAGAEPSDGRFGARPRATDPDVKRHADAAAHLTSSLPQFRAYTAQKQGTSEFATLCMNQEPGREILQVAMQSRGRRGCLVVLYWVSCVCGVLGRI